MNKQLVFRILGTLTGVGLLNLGMALIYATFFVIVGSPIIVADLVAVATIVISAIGMYMITDNAFIPLWDATHKQPLKLSRNQCITACIIAVAFVVIIAVGLIVFDAMIRQLPLDESIELWNAS